ncbi:MAG: hypothetical protein QME94_11175 [Anaerolineae bacterium]|nr:hypothetical protein [Anaerolineae bacterium]
MLAFSHPGEPIQLDVADVQVRELEILGTCRCPHTFGALVEFILQGRLRPEELITAVLPLEELAEAFALARSQEKNLFRILIRLGEE